MITSSGYILDFSHYLTSINKVLFIFNKKYLLIIQPFLFQIKSCCLNSKTILYEQKCIDSFYCGGCLRRAAPSSEASSALRVAARCHHCFLTVWLLITVNVGSFVH